MDEYIDELAELAEKEWAEKNPELAEKEWLEKNQKEAIKRRYRLFEQAENALAKATDKQLALVKLTVNGRETWRPAANFSMILSEIFQGKTVEQTGSNQEVLDAVLARSTFDADVVLLDKRELAEARGEFYPHLLLEAVENRLRECGIDLRPYQIYSARSLEEAMLKNPEDLTRHCLWNTLRRLLPDGGQIALAQLNLKTVIGVAVKKRTLARISELYSVKIRLLVVGEPGVRNQTRMYGTGDRTLEIGLISGHFFANDELVAVSTYAGLFESGRPLNVAKLLRKLHDRGLVQPYTPEVSQRLGLARTTAELRNTNPFLDELFIPDPNDQAELPAASGRAPQTETGAVWYADFETFEGEYGAHVPYVACAVPRGGGEGVAVSNPYQIANDTDKSLGRELLRKICLRSPEEKEVRIYFHNARYDANFLYDADLIGLRTVEGDGRLYQLAGTFRIKEKSWKITVRDTYSYIPYKLADFPKMFDIAAGEKWDDFPYALFTRARLSSYLTEEDLFSAEELALIPAKYKTSGYVEMYRYSVDYCTQDCEVLQQGFDSFRLHALELGLDVDHTMTAASFAQGYMGKEGVLDKVEPLSGSVRAYVQESVVGGRVCVRGNAPIHYVADKNDRSTHLEDLDAVSLYPSAMAAIPGLPVGRPEKFMGPPPDDDNYYVATVRVTSIGKELNFSTLSKVQEDGTRQWGKGSVKVGDVLILNRTQIESSQRHQGVVFEFVGGLRWPDGWNPKIRETIRKLFDWRLRLKAERNPLERVIKLIMNSAYGKLAQRPHDEKVKWIRGGEEEAMKTAAEAGTGFIYLDPANRKKTLWKLKYTSPDVRHRNRAHCGSLILAASKEIMYEVTTPLDEHVLYTDTDSIMIPAGGLAKLNRPDLIGKDLGQFHTDLSWSGDSKGGDVTATEARFLGKKTYVLQLSNSAAPGETQHQVRAKGIPNSTIAATCAKKGVTPLELYAEVESTGVAFDLTLGRPCFKQHPTNIATLKDFERTVGPFRAPEQAP